LPLFLDDDLRVDDLRLRDLREDDLREDDLREDDLREDDLREDDLRLPELIFRQRPDLRLRVVFPGTHFTLHLPLDLLRIIPDGHGGTRQRPDERLRL
jgi:hypothetical protein